MFTFPGRSSRRLREEFQVAQEKQTVQVRDEFTQESLADMYREQCLQVCCLTLILLFKTEFSLY